MVITRKIHKSNRNIYITSDSTEDRIFILQSYDAYVARIVTRGDLCLGPLWDCSPTTWRHVRKFIKKYIDKLRPVMQIDMYIMLNCKNGHKLMKQYVEAGRIDVIRTLEQLEL